MTSHGVLGLRRPVPTFGDPIADALSSPAGKSLIYGISVFLRFVLHLLLSAHALLDSVISTAHDRLCGLLALPPCDVHDPRESAVLIAGGDDDIGRPAAFSFSQLGYTVFVLCPDKPPAPLVHAGAGANVSSSSLIQEWHQRIKRSPGSPGAPWGLVAPIVLDMSSRAQRTRAFETVDAYCSTHHLRLVAALVLPPPRSGGPDAAGKPARGRAGLGDAVREGLMAPISLVDDYAALLAAAGGRVVLPVACGRPWALSLDAGVPRAAAQLLGEALAPLGVRVATVVIGPSAPVARRWRAGADAHAGAGGMRSAGLATAKNATDGGIASYIAGVRNAIEDALNDFAASEEEVCSVLRTIIRSRYPREQYAVGAHAVLGLMYDALPAPLRLCVRSVALHLPRC